MEVRGEIGGGDVSRIEGMKGIMERVSPEAMNLTNKLLNDMDLYNGD